MSDQATTIPKGWKKTTLGEMATINPTESIRVGKIAKYVAMDSLNSFTRKISKFELKEFAGGMKFRNGDTLLARITPCLENGKTSYVDILEENEVGFGSTEYIVIREKENLSDKKYLYYFSILPRFRETAIKLMTGTSGRSRVQTNSLINELFLFPSLPEQCAIGAVLSSLDDKIELLREQNKTLETTAQVIFKEWFVNYNFPGSTGKMIDSDLGQIPEGWRVGKLGELINFVVDNRGKTPLITGYTDNAIPLVEVNALIADGRVVDISQCKKFVNQSTYDSWFRKGHPKSGDILVSTVGSIGQIAQIFNEKISIAQNIIALRCDEFGNYLYQLLKSIQSEIISLDISSVQPSIKVPHLLNVRVIEPTDELKTRFEETVSPITGKIYQNTVQIQTLSVLRDSLLPKLMKGEVRVKGFVN